MAQLKNLIVTGVGRFVGNVYGNIVGTINGCSVNKSVPSDAKFTDTTYSVATQSAQGLMSAADKKKLDGIATISVGVVVSYSGSDTPSGYLLCDGSAISRTTYSALFAVIGTLYGSGNGSSTFNLPNLTNKFIEGSETAGSYVAAGLPNISGKLYMYTYSNLSSGSGAFHDAAGGGSVIIGSGTWSGGRTNISFDASSSNAVYGSSTTVQPPALTMRYIIKY